MTNTDAAIEYSEWADEKFPDTDAEVFIQWKGTTVCMDFRCPCGALTHYDGSQAYSVQCPRCGTTYDMGTQVRVRRAYIPFKAPPAALRCDGDCCDDDCERKVLT